METRKAFQAWDSIMKDDVRGQATDGAVEYQCENPPNRSRNKLIEEAYDIRARIEACPVHMSSATAFASALAANLCVTLDASAAFCFMRDVETEQLLGAYAVRTQKASATKESHLDKSQHASVECSKAFSCTTHNLASQSTLKAPLYETFKSLQDRFKTVHTVPGKSPSNGASLRERLPLDSLGTAVSALFSTLLVQDAHASNWGARAIEQLQETQDLIVVSSDSFVGHLLDDLRDGARAFLYDPATDTLSPLPDERNSHHVNASSKPFIVPPSDDPQGVLIACRLQDEGACSACEAMADARVTYVGHSMTRRLSPATGSSLSQGVRMEGTAAATRLASSESVVSMVDAWKSLPSKFVLTSMPHQSGLQRSPCHTQENMPLLSSATVEPPAMPTDEDLVSRFQGVTFRNRRLTQQSTPPPFGSLSLMSTEIALLKEQPDLHHTASPQKLVVAPLPHSSRMANPSAEEEEAEVLVSPGSTRSAHPETTLGVIFCINGRRPDAQLLVEAVAQVCSPPMALLLQQQWLRRDRFKRMLQLELHRTIFQETSIPIRMMQRLLALLHVSVGAEAAVFFIADAQNRDFICLGGHKRAAGLCLRGDHPLLGEATRQGGRTLVFNFLPPGFNKEYDARVRFETKHALLVPLLNTQGHVKAVVLLINRSQCSCERLERLEEEAEEQCACSHDVRAFEPLALAVDAWTASTLPCQSCSRKNLNDLSYGEFISKPLASLDIDCPRHFIRQCEVQHFLGGQLTNVCMAGMSLLQPMETMVSYVMGGQQRGGRNSTKPFGAVLEQIENFVLRDRKMKLMRLRRCASVAMTEPSSPQSLSDADIPRRKQKYSSNNQSSKPRHQHSLNRNHAASVVAWETRKGGLITSRYRAANFPPLHQLSHASLPMAVTRRQGYPEERLLDHQGPPLQTNSAPLVLLQEVSRSLDLDQRTAAVKELEHAGEEHLKLQCKRAASLPSLVFSATLQKCTGPFDAIRRQLSLESYRRLDLDIWRRTADELELFFFLALEELGVMVKSEKAGLQAFFGLIRDAYHTDNPYHNFYHAAHVTQVSSQQVYFSIHIHALSLAHDVDHPGVNNNSLCEQQHPLAIMYNDKAVLENHHAAFAARAMMKLGLFSRTAQRTQPQPLVRNSVSLGDAPLRYSRHHISTSADVSRESQQPYSEFEDQDEEAIEDFYPTFAEIRRVLVTCILATDMELFRHHHEAMRKRVQMKRTTGDSLNSEEDHALLTTCLIHCADISNPLLPERRNVQWASLIIQEFNAQVEMERHKGLPVTVFMDARTELLRTQSQIGFLSFVVLDQFRALADLVPGVEELVMQGEKNLEDWQAAMDILREAERRDT
ncbi:3 5 -cyclic nucleotide phosphodiesterase domain-containing protein [Cyclospora cayetanensis]|uniref:3 5-cyclic nucleotide phosphodiesterase domain-containing protein n=1 Tax=Cyclospora cayetanensis TaxID=88456 RepID=A0A1D3D8J0_9EIME|nr:3 5 -cyclic nucleotide phosphodiesterase domain-containing protein [Cyclospora cayetanensis]